MLFVDRKTGRVFLAFIKRKSDLEDMVRTMRRHMEMEAKESVEYTGEPIKVQRFVSDRDSDLTSDRAVAFMLKKRIKHVMAAADAKNHTPLLDNVARRILDIMRVDLDTSGLGPEYWEFSAMHAELLINLAPQDDLELKHSARTRWTGKMMNIKELRAFGADAFPHQELAQRPNKSKIDPVAPGGDGRFRWVGIDQGPGFVSRGMRILDTRTRTVRAMVNVELNEDMSEVRMLPKPAKLWENYNNSELIQYDIGDWGRIFEKPMPSMSSRIMEDDLVPIQESEEDEDGPPRGVGALEMERIDSDESDADSDSDSDGEYAEVEAPAADDQGRGNRKRRSRTHRGSRVRKKKRHARAEATRKLRELREKQRERDEWRWEQSQRIAYQQVNPKRPDSKCFKAYEKYKHARTVTEFLQLGGTWGALDWDRERGFVVERQATLAEVESGMAGWADAPAGLSKKTEQKRFSSRMAAHRHYAAHAAAFHATREANGVFVPEGISGSDRMLPYWEAAAASSEVLDHGLGRVDLLAREAARWMKWKRDESHSKVQELRELGERAYTTMMNTFTANVVEELSHVRASSVKTPRSFKEAMQGPFAEYWKKALEAEWANIREHGVYEWVPKPIGVKLIDSNYAWKCKSDDQGRIAKFKCRVVARGFRQLYGVHFHSSMAPVGKLQTFRVLLAEAARRGMDIQMLDVRSAYLCSEIDIPNYMTPPPGTTPPVPGHVMKLVRPLYGTRQGAYCWHKQINSDMLEWGFKASTADPCLYIMRRGSSVLRVLLFVDDMAIFSDADADGKAMKKEFIKTLGDKYKFSTGHDDHVYLGMAIHRLSGGRILLTQERYIEDVMLKFGFNECRGVMTPSPGGRVSKVDCFKGDPGKNPFVKRYRELCGVLRWIEQSTRPDISASLSELAKVQCNPGEAHVKRLNHLMRYVSSTRGMGILFGRKETKHAFGAVVGYVDSDWAGDPDSSYSRGGYVFESWQAPISWASFKMKAVAASSAESEYMAMSMATREAVWLRLLYSDMGYGDLSAECYGDLCDKDYKKVRLSDEFDPYETAMMLHGDNKAALAMSKNPVLHKRSKHIHVAFGVTRQAVRDKFVAPCYISTIDNTADIMTKELDRKLHRRHAGRMLVEMKGGKIFDIEGERMELGSREPKRDVLYRKPAPGLKRASEVATEKLLEICDDLQLIQTVVGKPTVAPIAVAATGAEGCIERTTDRMVDALVDRLVDKMAMELEKQFELRREMFEQFAELASTWRDDAIIDSGASRTYATKDVPLRNVRSGRGRVSVATGRTEPIAETGDLGVLRGVQRVNSFTRTLVSVTDLVDQFEAVRFDKSGAHVETKGSDGRIVSTLIGRPTASRLFGFDDAALSRHARKLGGDGG